MSNEQLELLRLWLPIGISFLAFCLSCIALGWNIYRDIVLKARVKVSFSIVRMVSPGQVLTEQTRFLRIGATNHGPGKVQITIIAGLVAPFWRRLFFRVKHFIIFNDHKNPLNPKLPAPLEVGDTLTLLLPYDDRCVLTSNATHIGLTDSFGRTHFAPKKHLKIARQNFRKDFPNAPSRNLAEKWGE